MTPKLKLFLDFDQTIVNAVEAYCETYNNIYAHCHGFEYAEWEKIKRWDLTDQCPMHTEPETLFASWLFFELLNPMDDNTFEMLEEIKEFCDITICTIGTPENIIRKTQWIVDNLGISDMILLSQEKITMDKSVVNMEGAVFVDDSYKNLLSSNADFKICFGTTEWNKDWSGCRVDNWSQLCSVLKRHYWDVMLQSGVVKNHG